MNSLGLSLRVIVSRRHFDVLKFICHLFDQSVSFWMSICSMWWSAGNRISPYTIKSLAKCLTYARLNLACDII